MSSNFVISDFRVGAIAQKGIIIRVVLVGMSSGPLHRAALGLMLCSAVLKFLIFGL